MKNLLKLIMIFCLIVSCSKESNIDQETDQVADGVTLNSEEIEFYDERDKYNAFYLDGTSITIDEYNALNLDDYPTILHDLANNKVEVFSTENNYEAYLKTDPELVELLAENKREALMPEFQEQKMSDLSEAEIKKMEDEDLMVTPDYESMDASKRPPIPPHFNFRKIPNYHNNIAFISRNNNHLIVHHVWFSPDIRAKITMVGNTKSNHQVRDRPNMRLNDVANYNFSKNFDIRNANRRKKTKTFWKNRKYRGDKRVIKFKANQTVGFQKVILKHKSYK